MPRSDVNTVHILKHSNAIFQAAKAWRTHKITFQAFDEKVEGLILDIETNMEALRHLDEERKAARHG